MLDDVISVGVQILDQSGGPIPHPTVWRAINYEVRHVERSAFPSLNVEDLWRVTQRYGGTSDIVSSSGDKPLRALEVPVLGNEAGQFVDLLDYRKETGVGNDYQRPDPLTFGYTFMKRGYLPGQLSFTLSRSERRTLGTVMLSRDPSQPLGSKPYLDEFDRIRWELSDTRRNIDPSESNRQRLNALRVRIEQVAQQAIAAGDNHAAARIYARARYMPEILLVDGQPAGWNQGDASSEWAKRAMARAIELDPDNVYVWMQTYIDRGEKIERDWPRERRAAMVLRKVEALIAAHGEAVWPEVYLSHANGYAIIGDFEKAHTLYLAAARLEPKYTNWSREVNKLKDRMRRQGVPVPANW